jgi:glutamate racemase
LTALAPWPVRWIDPAPAIARRVAQVLDRRPGLAEIGEAAVANFTSNAPPGPELTTFLAGRGLRWQSSASFAELPGISTAH